MTTWSFVIVAAGSGTRLGGPPKQFRMLGGRPVWRWSADVGVSLFRQGLIGEIVLVVPPGGVPDGGGELVCGDGDVPIRVAEGGRERSLSVLAGVTAATGDRVLIHDAARPFLDEALCRGLMAATSGDRGAVPVVSVTDAVKRLEAERVLPEGREPLRLTQTPQCFPREALLECLKQWGAGSRDEGEAWLKAGKELNLVDGDRWNFKITGSRDWEVAVMMASERTGRDLRTGIGFDVHPLTPGRILVLGGVTIAEAPLGLAGHSDADLVCHAVADAVLGAAGEPDIGMLFPASDPSYKGVSSLGLLRKTLERVARKGWDVVWVDVVLHAQVPRLARWVPEILRSLTSVLGSAPTGEPLVNFKVKSGEHVGAVGEARAMSCYAVATLKKR